MMVIVSSSCMNGLSVREGMWTLGELVVDDLEAIARDLPPQRLQAAAPEIIPRLTCAAVESRDPAHVAKR